ncbi:MAG: acetate--CoA ligase family protein [Kofleriaceae bacterium]|nr:acetate--CoA ligase family protein [Kofleriaceae bacterium]
MAQAKMAASAQVSPRVQVIAPAHLGTTAVAVLRARGIDARVVETPEPSAIGDDVVAWALASPPTPAATLALGNTCARAAAAGRPVCLLAPAVRGTGRTAIERAAALSYLRVHGAALGHDVDAWIEAVVMLVKLGLPSGPMAAVVAPAGSWLEAQALVMAADAETLGTRPPVIGGDEPTDVVLFDPALGAPPASVPGLHIPCAARSELADDRALLFGARAALGAITVLGRAAERIAVGLGPAPAEASAELAIDAEQLQRQLGKLGGGRVGDHETKVLLKAYGVPITRQAVATTPSAAVKLARRVVYPVELKPWGNDLPTEPAGCPVEKGVSSDALVRHGFTAVLTAAGKPPSAEASAVIVRETPPAGREVMVSLIELPSLGWTVVLDAPGGALAAAPAPLRLIDAQRLAAQVVSSRAGDAEPDRIGLANLLRRASHLAVDVTRLARLELPRVVIGGRGARTLVIDAFAELR